MTTPPVHRWLALALLLPLLSPLLWACDPRRSRDAGRDDAPELDGDVDGDGIADVDEGAGMARDTDGDGIPDAWDPDSDGDGIFDREEAGDEDPRTPPSDVDADGTPDAYDLDADGNGVEDASEGADDTDRDGHLDAHDSDDDGDSLSDQEELRGNPGEPPDSDHDGAPNHRDLDSDGDTIADRIERARDSDEDGIGDALDVDSDGDGLSDQAEAGDDDVGTPPIDSDLDGREDFRDPDSDDDGLSDRDEAGIHRTSPTERDTDGDGVGDWIEVAAGTDASSPAESPRTRGDFVFIVPYEGEPEPPSAVLTFRTRVQLADVYFLFDRSGSMGGEISALRLAVTGMLSELSCAPGAGRCARDSDCAAGTVCSFEGDCIEDPAARGCVASLHSGAGWYLTALSNVLSLQPSALATETALSFGVTGSDEWLFRALYGLSEPAMWPGSASGCGTTGIGCPAFRPEAVRIAVVLTDEDSDGAETAVEAARALARQQIHLIGVWSGAPASPERADLVEVTARSGSYDRSGSPLVFDGVDAAVVPLLRRAIHDTIASVPLRVTLEAVDAPGDDGDALPFIDELVAGRGACADASATDGDGDGVPELFVGVTPGQAVCWDVVARRNTFVPSERRPLLFHAQLTVRGDGSPLDRRDVYFLVPPSAPVIEAPE